MPHEDFMRTTVSAAEVCVVTQCAVEVIPREADARIGNRPADEASRALTLQRLIARFTPLSNWLRPPYVVSQVTPSAEMLSCGRRWYFSLLGSGTKTASFDAALR
jgi:hypothetical protein